MQYGPKTTSPIQWLTAMQGFSMTGHSWGSAPTGPNVQRPCIELLSTTMMHTQPCTEQFGPFQGRPEYGRLCSLAYASTELLSCCVTVYVEDEADWSHQRG
jgi:hypothetical protein